jgi:hypothetical protein
LSQGKEASFLDNELLPRSEEPVPRGSTAMPADKEAFFRENGTMLRGIQALPRGKQWRLRGIEQREA